MAKRKYNAGRGSGRARSGADAAGQPDGSDVERPARRPTFVVAAAFLAAIVVAGIVLAVVERGEGPDAGEAGGGSPATPGSRTPSAASASGRGSTAVPTAAPTDVSWDLAGGIAVPTSRSAGPTRVAGPVYSGYAHTPTGALMAALQISAREVTTPGRGWRQVVEQQTMPGDGQRRYIRLRAAIKHPAPPEGGYGQVAGYRFVDYTATTAVIGVVHQFAADSSLQANTYTMRWSDGDWRLQFTGEGTDGGPSSRLPDLTGYTKFRGI